jgi:propionate CoA-transferase
VFRAVGGTLELIEIAPGIDMERDIFALMAFRPRVAANLKRMDARIFKPEPMGLLSDINAMQQASRPEGRLLRASA